MVTSCLAKLKVADPNGAVCLEPHPPPAVHASWSGSREFSMLNGRRILIVEDDPIIALDLSQTLVSGGMIVVGIAATTQAAQTLAAENVIDAAVLDVRLELEDTLNFAKELQAKRIPYLFQTSDARLVNGFSPPPIVLAKPFAPERLIAALRKLLSM